MAIRPTRPHRGFPSRQRLWARVLAFLVVAVLLGDSVYALQSSWTASFELAQLGNDATKFRSEDKRESAASKKASVPRLLKTNPDALKEIVGSFVFSLGVDAYTEGKFSVASALWAPLAAGGNLFAEAALDEARLARRSEPLSYQELYTTANERIGKLKREKTASKRGLDEAISLLSASTRAQAEGNEALAMGLAVSALWSTVMADARVDLEPFK